MAELLTSNVTGNLTVSSNVATNTIISPVGTSSNITIDPDGTGNLVISTSTPVVIANSLIVSVNTTTGNIVLSNSAYITDLPTQFYPVTANTENLAQVFVQALAGRTMLSVASTGSRQPYPLQPFLGKNHVGMWLPPGNATTLPGVFGLVAPTANGTATARTVAATSSLNRARRLGYVSAAAVATQAAGYRQAANQFTMGTGTGYGGFYYAHRFGVSDATLPTAATATMFVGLNQKGTLPANGAANTANCVGVGQLAGSNNFFFCYGGTAIQPAINLGHPFYANNTTDIYELTMYAPSTYANVANTVIYYRFERIDSTGVNNAVTFGKVENTAVTVMPGNTVLLGLDNFRSAGTQALATGIDLVSLYIDSDYA
jgi:hypothetical protein